MKRIKVISKVIGLLLVLSMIIIVFNGCEKKAEEPTAKKGMGAKLLVLGGFRRRYPGDRNPT